MLDKFFRAPAATPTQDPWYTSSGRHTWERRLNDMPPETQPAIANLLEHGFTVVSGGNAPSTLHNAIADFKRIKSKAAEMEGIPFFHGKLRRVVNLHCASPALARLFTCNVKALAALDALFGAETTLYTSLFYEIGSSQDLHRDTPYFWTSPGYNYFGMWTALEDVDGENGCLEVVPKSHLLPEEDRRAIALAFYKSQGEVPPSDDRLWIRYQTLAQQQALAAGLMKQEVHVRAGDTIIWHPHTLHGGKKILNPDRSRLSLVCHVTPPNVRVYHHQAFFNLEFPVKPTEPTRYLESEGRRFIDHSVISFEHVKSVEAQALRGI